MRGVGEGLKPRLIQFVFSDPAGPCRDSGIFRKGWQLEPATAMSTWWTWPSSSSLAKECSDGFVVRKNLPTASHPCMCRFITGRTVAVVCHPAFQLKHVACFLKNKITSWHYVFWQVTHVLRQHVWFIFVYLVCHPNKLLSCLHFAGRELQACLGPVGPQGLRSPSCSA